MQFSFHSSELFFRLNKYHSSFINKDIFKQSDLRGNSINFGQNLDFTVGIFYILCNLIIFNNALAQLWNTKTNCTTAGLLRTALETGFYKIIPASSTTYFSCGLKKKRDHVTCYQFSFL